MLKENLFLRLFSLVLLVGVVFAISGCAKETKKDEPQTIRVTEAGLKIFDGQFYSFEYPANYTVKDQTPGYKILRVFNEKNQKVLEIYNDNDLENLGEAPADDENLEASAIAGFGEGEKRYAAILFSPKDDVATRELLFKLIDSAKTK